MPKKENLVFRKIPSLNFKYEINSDGTILRNSKSKRVIKQWKDSHNSKTEYWKCQINHGHNHIKKHFIHNLVAECWLGPKPKGYQTDHIDRNSLRNDYRNLRYVTKSDQMKNRDYTNFQDKLLRNLAIRNGGKVISVTLIKDNNKVEFASGRQAAKYLSECYPGSSAKTIEGKLYRKRKYIYDYEVQYKEYYLKCND